MILLCLIIKLLHRCSTIVRPQAIRARSTHIPTLFQLLNLLRLALKNSRRPSSEDVLKTSLKSAFSVGWCHRALNIVQVDTVSLLLHLWPIVGMGEMGQVLLWLHPRGCWVKIENRLDSWLTKIKLCTMPLCKYLGKNYKNMNYVRLYETFSSSFFPEILTRGEHFALY